MTTSVQSSGQPALPDTRLAVRWLFILTLFTSAGLLFMVQPLFGRMAMPILGGAPSVWNVAMVFFQTALLAGYFYAHMLSKLPFKAQVIIHSALLAGASLMLPVDIHSGDLTPDTNMPTLWLLGLMIKTVGLPFFAISAQAPLMQRWFARSTDAQASDPYFLYAASNIGSILGLLAYPALMEPFFTVSDQALVWMLGFVVLFALVVFAGIAILRNGIAETVAAKTSSPAISLKTQLHWIALAAVPSGLLLSVTNNITTDIAAMPLMWAPPLLAYLLSFVVAFAPPKWLPASAITRLSPIFVLGLALMGVFASQLGPTASISFQVFLFFMVALGCHSRLATARPAADRLTQFYLLMSLGGALGGAAVALVAPVVFNWVFEHPILIALSALLLAFPPEPATGNRVQDILGGHRHRYVWDVVFILTGIVCAKLVLTFGQYPDLKEKLLGFYPAIIVLIALCFLARYRTVRFSGLVSICAITFSGWLQMNIAINKEFQARSFFGIYRVGIDTEAKVRLLTHGTTVHGAQSLLPELVHQPQSYYVPTSGVGRVLAASPAKSVGIVGLGSGALACYAKPEQSWTFYEIDPLVVRIAQNKKLFTYLSDCAPAAAMQIGDARLKLREATDGKYDLLAIDAFSSDSIPLHLITANAFDLYRAKLARNGILMVHISNRYMDLRPVVGNIAKAQGWQAWAYRDKPADTKTIKGTWLTGSMWIMLTPTSAVSDAQFARMPGGNSGWKKLEGDPARKVWTDNYANTLSVLKWLQ